MQIELNRILEYVTCLGLGLISSILNVVSDIEVVMTNTNFMALY